MKPCYTVVLCLSLCHTENTTSVIACLDLVDSQYQHDIVVDTPPVLLVACCLILIVTMVTLSVSPWLLSPEGPVW